MSDYIRSQIGGGADSSEINRVDVYEIEIGLILAGDKFIVNHNCGNEGLKDGILLDLIGRISKREVELI